MVTRVCDNGKHPKHTRQGECGSLCDSFNVLPCLSIHWVFFLFPVQQQGGLLPYLLHHLVIDYRLDRRGVVGYGCHVCHCDGGHRLGRNTGKNHPGESTTTELHN